MIVIVNGDKREFEQQMSLAQLLADLGLSSARVAVEVNREVVPRARFAERLLADGDKIEVVHFVGGGL